MTPLSDLDPQPGMVVLWTDGVRSRVEAVDDDGTLTLTDEGEDVAYSLRPDEQYHLVGVEVTRA